MGHRGDIKFLVVDSDGVRLLDRHCLAVLGDLLRIDRDPSVSIVRSFDRVRISAAMQVNPVSKFIYISLSARI